MNADSTSNAPTPPVATPAEVPQTQPAKPIEPKSPDKADAAAPGAQIKK